MAQYDDDIVILDDSLDLPEGCWWGEVGGEADMFVLDIKVTTHIRNNIYKGVS